MRQYSDILSIVLSFISDKCKRLKYYIPSYICLYVTILFLITVYYFNIICFGYFSTYIASILRSDLILYNCFMLTIDVEDNVYLT